MYTRSDLSEIVRILVYWLNNEGKGFDSWQEEETLLVSRASILVVHIQPLIQWAPAFFFSQRISDWCVQLPFSSSGALKNVWSYTPVAPCVHALVLKQRDEISTTLENFGNYSPSVAASYNTPWQFSGTSVIIWNHACTRMMFRCFMCMVQSVAVCGMSHLSSVFI